MGAFRDWLSMVRPGGGYGMTLSAPQVGRLLYGGQEPRFWSPPPTVVPPVVTGAVPGAGAARRAMRRAPSPLQRVLERVVQVRPAMRAGAARPAPVTVGTPEFVENVPAPADTPPALAVEEGQPVAEAVGVEVPEGIWEYGMRHVDLMRKAERGELGIEDWLAELVRRRREDAVAQDGGVR